MLLGDINAPKRSKSARFFFFAQLYTQELFKTLYRVIVPVLKVGGLSHYLPSHNSFDFSFIFEATLGTLEAIVYKK